MQDPDPWKPLHIGSKSHQKKHGSETLTVHDKFEKIVFFPNSDLVVEGLEYCYYRTDYLPIRSNEQKKTDKKDL